MKSYRVIALSCGGHGNKIYKSGDVVKEGSFPPGRAEELVKKKFLELIVGGEKTEVPLSPSVELTEADKKAIAAAVENNKAIDQRELGVIPAGTLKEGSVINIEDGKVSVSHETDDEVGEDDVDLDAETEEDDQDVEMKEDNQDVNSEDDHEDKSDVIDEIHDETPSEITSIEGQTNPEIEPAQDASENIKVKQFTNSKGELAGASKLADITKVELMKELVKDGISFGPQDSKGMLFDLWFNA